VRFVYIIQAPEYLRSDIQTAAWAAAFGHGLLGQALLAAAQCLCIVCSTSTPSSLQGSKCKSAVAVLQMMLGRAAGCHLLLLCLRASLACLFAALKRAQLFGAVPHLL
jgi:hypothetical protein